MKAIFFRLCEIVLGVIFLGSGLNGYVVLFGLEPFIPTSPAAMDFLGSGYLLALVKTTETVCGIMLLLHRFIPLTLLVLASLITNILAFHIFIDQQLLPLAIFLLILEGTLLWRYRASYRELLKKKAVSGNRISGR